MRIPYNVVCPLEYLSSYQGRLGPGDVCFRYRYPPGFTKSRDAANNATLGVNTLSRVVGLDGLNRLLMGSGPNGWRLGENVFEVPDNKMEDGAYGVLSSATDGVFALTALNEYRLDGVIISNDEPGLFTSSGNRDNAIFNIAIQGPTETNNGFLRYEDPTTTTAKLYNPLTGVTNSRTVEAHARGSAESGMHIENTPLPGRVGSDFQNARGKIDFVANYCGTYAMYPSQMFDRRVETMNTLYIGLRAYELSIDAKRQVTTSTGEKRFSESDSDAVLKGTSMYFYQYLPFGSRVAHVIQSVTDKHFDLARNTIASTNGVDAASIPAAEIKAFMARPEEAKEGRAKAAIKVGAIKQQTATNLPSAHFDAANYDPIRSEDMWSMIGAWQVGRVLDSKAAVHERYAGGPRDTAFSCIVDVNVAWRSAVAVQISPDTKADVTGFLLDPSERTERGGQQTSTTLANNLSPALKQIFGPDFGRDVAPASNMATQQAADNLREMRMLRQQQVREEEAALARVLTNKDVTKKEMADKMADAVLKVRELLRASPNATKINELLSDTKFGQDPMVDVKRLLQLEGVEYPEVPREIAGKTEALWVSFMDARNDIARVIGSTSAYKIPDAQFEVLRRTKAKWQAAADAEIKFLMKNSTPSLSWWALGGQSASLKAALKKKIDVYLKAMQEVKAEVEKDPSMGVDAAASVRASRASLSALLNRANIMSVLFCTVVQELGDRSCSQAFVLKTAGQDIQKALEDGELLDELMHFSSLCDLHEKYFPVDELYFPLIQLAKSPPPAAVAATGAPTPVRPVAAAPATRTGASAGASKATTKGRGKSPARPRPGTAVPTGASTSAPAPSPAPTPAASLAPVDAVPAAAAGMSSVPLAPTQVGAGSAVTASRRRAREAATGSSESVTDSLFENMFKPSATDASIDEPASPTPSSGSEGPSGGPRTFRRQR